MHILLPKAVVQVATHLQAPPPKAPFLNTFII